MEIKLFIYPLKQGLKRKIPKTLTSIRFLFISYYPLKQGLKLCICLGKERDDEYILLSIKTRIETKPHLFFLKHQ